MTKTNTTNENNRKASKMLEVNINGCHAITGKGNQCEVPQKNMVIEDDGRRFCSNHRPMFIDGRLTEDKMIVVPPVQEQLIKVLETQPSVLVRTPAEVIAGIEGVHRASEVLAAINAGDNPITNAYLNKEAVVAQYGPDTDPNHATRRQAEEEEEMLTTPIPKDTHIIGFSGGSGMHGNWPLMRLIKDDATVPGLKKMKAHFGDDLGGIVGGAPGFDYVAARSLMECEIPYTVVLPSDTYVEYYWNVRGTANPRALESITEFDMARILDVLDNAEHVVYACEDHMWGKANFVRNERMVDGSDEFWVYDPSTRGTSHAFGYAKKVKKMIRLVPIQTLPAT